MKKMIKNRQDARRKRGGFTLVELVVVLALIGILLAFSAGGIIGYTTYATYKRNNDSAKAVFSAAQSAISYYKASGKLESFRKDVEDLPHDPAFVPVEALKDSDSERVNDTISYLMMSNDEYDAIKTAAEDGDMDPAGLDDETKLLYKMLSDYITDVGIYNASICVEFDATDGVVSGVLYCDKDVDFSYGDSDGTLNITERGDSYRRRKGLGYYSTELSERAPEKVENLKVAAASMVNAESLDVQWFLKKQYQYLKSTLDYTVTLYDGEDESKLAEIALGADDLGFVTREESGQTTVTAKNVTLYDASGNACYLTSEGIVSDVSEMSEDSEVKFHAYLVEDGTGENYGSGIALSLDVLDSHLTEAMELPDKTERQTEILSTYSARRLSYEDETGDHYGVDPDGLGTVYAKVSVTTNTEDTGAQTNAENLFFAKGTEDSGDSSGDVYEIENARHLYNVGMHEQDLALAGGSGSATYNITRDFGWGGPDGLLSFVSTGSAGGATYTRYAKFYAGQSEITFEKAAEGEAQKYPAFPGIAKLNAGSVLCSAESTKEPSEKKDEDKEDEDGEAAPPWTIDHLALEPAQKMESGAVALSAVGLVRENEGRIKELNLAHVDVRGVVLKKDEDGTILSDGSTYVSNMDVGAFCGVNNGTLENVQTLSGSVTGGKNVGGIVGRDEGTSSGLKNGAEVSGVENVGGIVGQTSKSLSGMTNSGLVYGWEAPAGTTLERLDPSDPAEAGDPDVMNAASKYIGGIVGYAGDGTSVTKCTSAPKPQEDAGELTDEMIKEKLYGTYVGGIVGYTERNVTISDCQVGAEDSASYITGKDCVGGVAGGNAGALTIQGGTVSGTVVGRNMVGGLVGYNDSAATINSTATTDMLDVRGNNLVGGVIGLNTSADLFENGTLTWAVRDVQGDSYVGGYAGANIVAPAGELTIKPEGAADTVTAHSSFAGGLFGYNRVVAPEQLDGLLASAEMDVDGAFGDGGDVTQMIRAGLAAGQPMEGSGEVSSLPALAVFRIDQSDSASDSASFRIAGGSVTGRVEAQVFAGGLLGYNAANTILTIEDYTGKASVTATGALSGDDETINGLLGLSRYGTGKRYSFSGGILGYVTKNTTLDSCGLESGSEEETGATVTAVAATYLGGLAEINEGTITSCTAATVGTAGGGDAGADAQPSGAGITHDNVGGIVGVNGYTVGESGQQNAVIQGGTVPATAVVSGGNVVGGLAAENYGWISPTETADAAASEGTVLATGTDVGGIAGANYGTIADVTGSAKVTLSASTGLPTEGNRNAGGIAGRNEGTIQSASLAPSFEIKAETGAKAAMGGLVGENRGSVYLESEDFSAGAANAHGAINTANAAYAGTIAGKNSGTIDQYPEELLDETETAASESVQVAFDLSDTQEAPATIGGIAGWNQGTISNLFYSGTITGNGSAPAGAAVYAYGGIAGINTGDGSIEDCGLAATVRITSNGSNYVGGFAGVNSGNADIRNDDSVNTSESGVVVTSHGALATGGIVGLNTDNATVRNMTGAGTINEAQTSAESGQMMGQTSGPVGGVIGLHQSTAGLYGLKSYATLKSDGEAVGGIVGRVAMERSANAEEAVTIQSCANYGSVSAADKAGGIVGEWASGADGSIRGCFNGRTVSTGLGDGTTAEKDTAGDTSATIQATQPAGAAGIVGSFSGMNGSQRVKIEILSCANFGVIENSLGAGIAVVSGAQTAAAEQSSLVKITDCANAGRISSGAGIAVYHSGQAGNSTLELDRCRNYGRPVNVGDEERFVGLVANIYNEEDGTPALDLTNEHLESGMISLANSIGVADVKYPTVASSSNDEAGYTRASERYGNTNKDKDREVYYYSVTENASDPQLNPLATAGLGSAVNYLNGEYQRAFGDQTVTVKDCLKAVNALVQNMDGTSAGETFNPNGSEYKPDCRGNYNRLERTLAAACLNLVKEEGDRLVDVDHTPAVSDLDVANNGGVLNITWKNTSAQADESAGDGEPSIGDETDADGVVYCTKLELGIYNEKPDNDSAGSLANYSVILYGDTTAHNVPVSKYWMEKWAKVSVTNYSYGKDPEDPTSGVASETITKIIQIHPALKNPEIVVRLQSGENGEGNALPTYVLQLLNASDYAGKSCRLEFNVQAETLTGSASESVQAEIQEEGQDGAQTGGQTESVGDGGAGTQEGSAGDAQTGTQTDMPAPAQPEESGVYKGVLNIGTGDNSFELSPGNAFLTPADAGFFATAAAANVRLKFTDVQVLPNDSPDAGVQATGTTGSSMSAPSAKLSFTATTPAANKLAMGLFRGEDTEQGRIWRSENAMLSIMLPCEPAMYRAELLRNVEMGDYLLENIVTAATWSEATDGILNMNLAIPSDQVAEKVHARVYPLKMSGSDAKAGAEFAYLVEENLSLAELVANPLYVAVTQASAGGAQPETKESEQTEAGGSQPEETETGTEKNLSKVTVQGAYSVVLDSDGLFDVYKYPSVVLDWEEPDQDGTATTSAAGAGAAVAPAGGAASESETEEDTELTEEETETETAEQSETQAQTQSETANQTESETQAALPAPQSAALSPDWASTTGTAADGTENEALPEAEFFQNGVTVTVDEVPNASVYQMKVVGFYKTRPEGTNVPDPAQQIMNTGYEDAVFTLGGRSIMFQDLPTSYSGKYLCVQFCAYTADYKPSAWSDYIWLRLPKIRLEEVEMEAESETATYMQTERIKTAEGETTSKSSVTLTQLALTWEQEKPESESEYDPGWDDQGYRLELYKLLPSTETNQDILKSPTATINLMRGTFGYYLERDWTAEEKKAWDIWLAASEIPGLSMPNCCSINIAEVTESSADDELREELTNESNLRIYQIDLDSAGSEITAEKMAESASIFGPSSGDGSALGAQSYSVTYQQEITNESGTTTWSLAPICPKLQIREYTDPSTGDVSRIEYKLILPDVQRASTNDTAEVFLNDYATAYCTHSVVLEPLTQSVYKAADADIETNRRQYTYLNNKSVSEATAANALKSYRRTLEPDENAVELDWAKEKKKLEKQGQSTVELEGLAATYGLLPRAYGEGMLVWHNEAAASILNAQFGEGVAQINLAFDSDGNLVVEPGSEQTFDEGATEGDIPEVIEEGDGFVSYEPDDDFIIEEENIVPEISEEPQAPTEPQTQAQAEPQTQPPTEPQTQPPTETQTQSQAEVPAEPQVVAEAVTEAVEAFTDQAEGVMAEGFPEIPVDPGTYDGEGY